MSKLLRIYGEKVAIGGGHQPTAPLHVSHCDNSYTLPALKITNIAGADGTISINAIGDGAGGHIDFGGQKSSGTERATIMTSQHGSRYQAQIGWLGSTTATGSRFYFQTANPGSNQTTSERLSILANGNVGIGEDSPISPLTIRKSDGGGTTMGYDSMALLIGGADANNEYTTIGFNWINISNYTGGHPAVSLGYQPKNFDSYTYGDLVFATRNANGNVVPTERMRIDAVGNVGIGTAAPRLLSGYDSTSRLSLIHISAPTRRYAIS